jgi:hypothetical protein
MPRGDNGRTTDPGLQQKVNRICVILVCSMMKNDDQNKSMYISGIWKDEVQSRENNLPKYKFKPFIKITEFL